MNKMYVVKHPGDVHYVAILHGELGYHEFNFECSDDQAALLNDLNGVGPAEVEAAIGASMFGWDCFEKLVALAGSKEVH